jgi:nucleoside 2-deoxyribosyltransferase
MQSELLRPAQIAPLLGITTRELARAASRGEVPFSNTPHGGRRFDPREIAEAYRARGLRVPLTLEPPALVPLPAIVSRVYVAGPSSELNRCEKAMRRAERGELSITYRWTDDVRAGGDSPNAAAFAAADLAGVASADVLLLLLPSEGHATVGAWVELGAAAALRKPIVVSAPAVPGMVRVAFPYSALVHTFQTDRAAIRELISRAPRASKGVA